MIQTLSLRNFRNFAEADLNFQSRSVVICGANGQGKTSLLESVFYMSSLRSFRTRNMDDLRKIGSDKLTVDISVKKQILTDKLRVISSNDGNYLVVNGENIRKSGDFIGRFRVIAFLPDDIEIIRGSSVVRRRFLDLFISMIDRGYFRSLQQYHAALKNRNFLIRDAHSDKNLLRAFHPVMAEHGAEVVKQRFLYARIFTDFMKEILHEIRPELQDCEMRMRSSRELEDPKRFAQRLDESVERDREKGYTSFGPQADDFDFRCSEKSLRTYGSRGQCRMVSFALKLAGMEIFNSCGGSRLDTVVIADDATGDLDERAKCAFYDKISQAGQVFHAFTNMDDSRYFPDSQIISVSDGKAICHNT